MRSRLARWAALLACVSLTACTHGALPPVIGIPVLPQASLTQPMPRMAPMLPPDVRESCPGPAPIGFARCEALVRTDVFASGASVSSINGYAPADLQSAYRLPVANGTGQIVAVIDAFDDATAQSDLNVYRTTFGLPPCTSATGCFRKVNETGTASPLPAASAGWSEEISVDLDMVSAICPKCRILLVEARSASFTDLGAAVNTAVRLGAGDVSNSYGGTEFAGEVSMQAPFQHSGVAFTASSGDSGYGPQFPAASRFVTAVGGTSLIRAANARGWSESAWRSGGSGCSAYVGKPTWQHDYACARRTIADVAAVGDPNTGVAVYDRGWYEFGGTSVGAPIIAAVYALAGNARTTAGAQDAYLHPGSLFDVTTGANGLCAGGYLCNAGAGYDGPTGNGTPDGIGAF